MNVWISGPTGSGKSSLARILAKRGYVVIREDLPNELFRAFGDDPQKNCERLQEAIINSRFAQWQRSSAAKRIVFDRSIDEDIAVFCQMHRELGYLSDAQLTRLQELATTLQANTPSPDLVIFLRPADHVVRERILREGHPPVIVDSLDLQLRLYSEWLKRRRDSVVRIDNSDCDLNSLAQFFLGEPHAELD